MLENENRARHAKAEPEKKEQPKRTGVGIGVVILITVLALVCGGVLGWQGAQRYSGLAKQLAEAQEECENYSLLLASLYSEEFENASTGLDDFGSPSDEEDEGNSALFGEFDTDDESSAEPVIVAEFNGGEVTDAEVEEAFEEAVAGYSIGGEDLTDYSGLILNQVLEELVSKKVAYRKAEELGLTVYSDADEQRIAELAKQEYDRSVGFYTEFFKADDMTEEEARAEAVSYLEINEGYTVSSVEEEIRADYWYDRLAEQAVGAITVSDDEITALYNDTWQAQKEQYDADPTAFENDLMSGETVLYYPEGYRAVKQIFLEMDLDAAEKASELRAKLKDADETAAKELQAQLDAVYAPLEEQMRSILEELDQGGDFDELMHKYSDDTDLSEGVFAQSGYFISARSELWPSAFVEACMALETPGERSGIVRSENGVHLIYYIRSVEAGAVPIASVRDRLAEETLAEARAEAFDAQLAEWVDAAEPKYYPERMTGYDSDDQDEETEEEPDEEPEEETEEG